MSGEERRENRSIARRSLLGLAVVGGTAAGLSFLFPDRRASEISAPSVTPSPSPTPKPTPDMRYLANLKSGKEISGHEKVFGRAYSTLKILEAVPLTNYRNSSKLRLAVSVVGHINELQIIDPSVGNAIHTLNLPDDSGHVIDSMVWDEPRQRLYVSVDGSVLAWNPAIPEQFNTLVDVEGASVAYELRLDSSGNLWGGTYPLGASFNYNVESKKLRVFDRVAEDTDYIRRLALDGRGRVWMGTGSRNPRLFTFEAGKPDAVREINLPVDVAHGFIGSIDPIGHYLAVTVSSVSEQLILDTRTMKWHEPVTRVWASREISKASSGRFFSITAGHLHSTAFQGMDDKQLGKVEARGILCIIPQNGRILIISTTTDGILCETFDLGLNRVRATREIRLTPSAIKIQSLLGHSDGNIYIGGYKANGVAALNPETGVRWNSGDDEQVINQIEGMVEYDQNKTYIGSYGSADLVLMETPQNNADRKYDRIARLLTEYSQSRPFGWASNSSSVFFGTVPEYGVSGGVLGKIDPATDTVSWVLDGDGKGFVSGHSIIGLAADESHLYGTTSVRNGYGVEDTKSPAKVFKMHIASRKILWETSPVESAGALYSPAITGGWLAVADLQGVALLDLDSGQLKKRHIVNNVKNTSYRPGWLAADVRATPDGQKMVHAAGGGITVLDYVAGTTHSVVSTRSHDRHGTRLTVGADGHVYGILNQTTLVQLALEPELP
ncbi:hypothetical protein [Glutamicibacter sp. NPDC087673]|uniref:hypothetical protein n=1 Tax=Glutamicibacter sp. NPDC087673 TaxID=3363997 RepID=UPI00381A04D9